MGVNVTNDSLYSVYYANDQVMTTQRVPCQRPTEDEHELTYETIRTVKASRAYSKLRVPSDSE